MKPAPAVRAFEDALLTVDRAKARDLLTRSAEADTLAAAVEHVVVPALERIGACWERGDIALSQVYMSGRITDLPLRTSAAMPTTTTVLSITAAR